MNTSTSLNSAPHIPDTYWLMTGVLLLLAPVVLRAAALTVAMIHATATGDYDPSYWQNSLLDLQEDSGLVHAALSIREQGVS